MFRNRASLLLLTSLALLPVLASAQNCADYRQTIHFAGTYSDVSFGGVQHCAQQWDYCFTAGGDRFHATEMSDPYNPGATTTIFLSDVVHHFVLRPDAAYLAVGSVGICKVDLSSGDPPFGPTITPPSCPDLGVQFVRLALTDNLLIALDYGSDLWVFDPETLAVLGTWTGGVTASDMGASGSHAYLATSDGLVIISLSDPSAPTMVTVYDDGYPGNPNSSEPAEYDTISLCGDTLAALGTQWYPYYDGWSYYIVQGPFLFTLDLTDPEAPEYLHWEMFHTGDVLHLTAEFLVVTNTGNDFFTLLETDTWTKVTRLPVTSDYYDASLEDGRLVFPAAGNELAIYDAIYPAQVVPLVTYGAELYHQGGSARFDLATHSSWSGHASQLDYFVLN